MAESLSTILKKNIREIIHNDLSRYLGWQLLLSEELATENKMAAILVEFDIAAVMSVTGPKVTGYVGVGFKESLAINLALNLKDQFKSTAVDIYAATDPLVFGKDPYADTYVMADNQLNEQVEDAVRQVASFAVQSLTDCLRKDGILFAAGLPMIVVGKKMTSFAAFPLSAVMIPFFFGDGCGCLEFAIADPEVNPYD
ncbi:MAG: hypothetical protein WCG06_04260 [Candidatus Omnitrophota bacterium]